MKRRHHGSSSRGEHQEVLDLLPWYLNATLEEAEARRVEAHLGGCVECAEELARCRRLAAAVREAGEVAPSPHPAGFARLMARIDAAEAGGVGGALRRRLGAGWRRLSEPLWRAPAGVRWALAAELAAIGLLAALLLRPAPAPPALYRTLSDPVAAATSAQPRLRVVFADDVTEGEMRRLLLGIRAEIASGPSPFGAYTLVLPAGGAGDPLAEVVAHLRAQDKVRFVEVIAEGGGGP
jgi:Putative zinc-finger